MNESSSSAVEVSETAQTGGNEDGNCTKEVIQYTEIVENRILENLRKKIEHGILNPAFNALISHALKPLNEVIEKSLCKEFNDLKTRALAYGEYKYRFDNNKGEENLEFELVKDILIKDLNKLSCVSPILVKKLKDMKTGKYKIWYKGKWKEIDMANDKDKEFVHSKFGNQGLKVLPGNPPSLSRPNFKDYIASWDKNKLCNQFDLEVMSCLIGRPVVIVSEDGSEKVLGPQNGKEPVFIKHTRGDTEDTGHFSPIIRVNGKPDVIVNDLPNTGNACGVESLLYCMKSENLLTEGKTMEEAHELSKNFVSKPENIDSEINAAKNLALSNPGFRNLFLGRSHEWSSIVGGARRTSAPGTYRYRNEERIRLNNRFNVSITGANFEMEHPIGYRSIVNNTGIPRTSPDGRRIEGDGLAYYEQRAAHRGHTNTGSNRITESGLSTDEYRLELQPLFLETGTFGVGDSIQLMNIDYAHQQNFSQNSTTNDGLAARDSYNYMLENGPSSIQVYNSEGNIVNLSFTQEERAEAYLSRQWAETGAMPTSADVQEASARFDLPPITYSVEYLDENRRYPFFRVHYD